MIRAALLLSSYLTGVWIFLVMVCLMPGRTLALVSPQAFSRVVAQAEWIAHVAANKAPMAAKVATAVAAESPASVAFRAVAGPIGWAALGISAGMVLYEMYYSQPQAAALKEASRQPGTASVAGIPVTNLVQGTPGSCGSQGGQSLCDGAHDQSAHFTPSPNPFPAGWEGSPVYPNCYGDATGCKTWVLVHRVGQPNAGVQNPGAYATPGQVADYVQNLPDSDPLSIPAHTQPVGKGGATQPASDSASLPVNANQLPSTVKPTSQVQPGDITIADHVPPPEGTQQTAPTTQTSTTTTTSTTNPDGSVTEEKTTTATSSCTASGGHEERTMGSVLAEHQAIWTSSGLLGAVTLLKNLTWPTTLPVVDLPSAMFGMQHVDFNQWAWFFAVLRTLVIAVASLAAYRIIFVGGR